MSKLIAKSKTLWEKATHRDKKETGNIPSGVDWSHLKVGLGALSSSAEIAGFTPLAKSAEIVKQIVEIIELFSKRQKIQRMSRTLLSLQPVSCKF
ncbi:hypothetical protein BT96DRAFT_191046 [Gymnopus androsaceus JB14]|uniref:Uncharacterized protein n=1 Tax=Gymnopus androsaceus JB14 TaxID=1447944 RepID=A0A6A4IDN1_9AGAR|nr:hypothetical protein BT96DRAFT_191046 [Gymnopus androsaceus JB14]